MRRISAEKLLTLSFLMLALSVVWAVAYPMACDLAHVAGSSAGFLPAIVLILAALVSAAVAIGRNL